MPRFSVDTHLFRELGELLVGRDSTALVELIKNAYDADAEIVTVHGSGLRDGGPAAEIVVTDDGHGMTAEVFEDGFLRIASRRKDDPKVRRSPKFGRRFTGAKGVGRLAAHKIARRLIVSSTPDLSVYPTPRATGVEASIDWEKVESKDTLDQLDDTDAIVVGSGLPASDSSFGTEIRLQSIRRNWTDEELKRFFDEVQGYQPPSILVDSEPTFDTGDSLLDGYSHRDTSGVEPGFSVVLTGDFDTGENYWQTVANQASWILEIRSNPGDKHVQYRVAPSKARLQQDPESTGFSTKIVHPSPETGPFFAARILIKEGTGGAQDLKEWADESAGVRVYMEGFRVLPYGEPTDDWLGLDATAVKKSRLLPFLDAFGISQDPEENAAHSALRKRAYFGAVFLTLEQAPTLRMLVNREGFIPEAGFLTLQKLVGLGIDFSTRHRHAANAERRAEWRKRRHEKPEPEAGEPTRPEKRPRPTSIRDAVEDAVDRATTKANDARQAAATGDIKRAEQLIKEAASEFETGADARQRLLTEDALVQILASVGLQMHAFVHELKGFIGMARTLEDTLQRLRTTTGAGPGMRRELANLASQAGDLRRHVERQAAYLADVASPDMRRRRSRQNVSERFAVAVHMLSRKLDEFEIRVQNDIPPDLKTRPMFPSELGLILSNLLTNAVEASGVKGRIRVFAEEIPDGVSILMENTGKRVDPREGERWFRPFESTKSDAVDPELGQGMGMGLPLTRNMVEEYGGSVEFIAPTSGFATAVRLTLME